MRPVLSTEPTSEAALVREQGGWGLAARLFSASAVGIAGTIVGLSSLATSIGILGLDNGLVRYAARASRPRALMWRILLVGGGLASVVGLVISLIVLSVSQDTQVVSILPALVLLTVTQTTSQTCFQITDASILAARKSEYLAYRAVSYGIAKIVLLFALLQAGVVGLSAAYTLPLLVIMLVSLVLVRRVWPLQNDRGTPVRLRDVASLSAGNWISGLVYSLPSRVGPALMLIFIGAGPTSYFFIALQLAEVLNYIPEAVSKSLYAHGSIRDRLPASLTASMRRLLAAILVPMVALGVVLAQIGMTIVGGTQYGAHYLALQLFLLATLPKAGIQIYKAQFNVDRRPLALIVLGGTLGISTVAFFVVGLLLDVPADWLPLAWVLGGTLALGVGWWLSRRKAPGEPEAQTAAAGGAA
jgi:O-antigen/teichoic acid export membrane protein